MCYIICKPSKEVIFIFKIVILLLFVIIFNLLETIPKIRNCKKYIKILEEVDENDNNQLDELMVYKTPIMNLLVGAHVPDKQIIRYMDTDDIVPMPATTSIYSVFPHEATVYDVEKNLKQALGFYQLIFRRMLSPLYWIRFFMNLPAHIVNYLGFKSNGIRKILNVIWWSILAIWWIFTPEIEKLRLEFLDTLYSFLK